MAPVADPDDLRAMLQGTRAQADHALTLTRDHLATARPAGKPGYVAWSGGMDSTAVAVLATTIDPTIPVVLFDSGIEFPETLTYVHDLAAARDWNLHVIPATPPALDVLAATRQWTHDPAPPATAAGETADVPSLHDVCITAPARRARRRHGHAELWGLRANESAARAALLTSRAGTFTRADGTRTTSPIWSWTTATVRAFLRSRGVPLNPVYGRLASLGAPSQAQRVGMMIDGNGLEHGRAHWLRHGWPDQWARLTHALPRLDEWT